MIVADSSVWIDHFNKVASPGALRLCESLAADIVGVGDLILVEVLQGLRGDEALKKVRPLLVQLYIGPMVGLEIGLAAARNYRTLRERGVTIRKTIDVLIATFCIENGHLLLHSDRDFDVMAEHLGLKVA